MLAQSMVIVKRKLFLATLFWVGLTFPFISGAQAPDINWDKTVGEEGDEALSIGVAPTTDGGYVSAGLSYSQNSNGTFYVVKVDQKGTVLWTTHVMRPFVYNTGPNYFYNTDGSIKSMAPAPDGGCVLAGEFYYTEYSGGIVKNSTQNWAVRLDALGNILWDKTYTKSGSDHLQRISQTSDGNFILGGINGTDSKDFWLLTINGDGNIVSDLLVSGTSYVDYRGFLYDGTGYILSGLVDKGNNFFAWRALKVDPSGLKLWEKEYPTSLKSNTFTNVQLEPIRTSSQTLALGGMVYNNTSAPITYSYKVLSIDNQGNLSNEYLYSVGTSLNLYNIQSLTPNGQGGFLLYGSALNVNNTDAWIKDIGADGKLVWEKSFGGNGDESFMPNTVSAQVGKLFAGITSNSDISGNKSENAIGSTDFWLVSLMDAEEDDEEDTEAPVLLMPNSITVNNDPGKCGALVAWTPPVITDNEEVTQVSSTSNPGDYFPVGTTTIEYTASDEAGNTSKGTFTITVNDAEAPVPTQANLPSLTAECTLTIAEAPTALDQCNGIITGKTDKALPLVFSGQGTYLIQWTFTDSKGNSAIQEQTVAIKDITPPVMGSMDNIIVNNDPGRCGAIVIFPAPVVTDNCGVKSILRTDLTGLMSGDVFPVGSTTISYSATDQGGNVVSTSFTVTVNNTAPVIQSVTAPVKIVTLNTPVSLLINYTDNNLVTATIEWGDGTSSEGAISAGTVTATHTYQEAGFYNVEVEVTDACGLEAEFTFKRFVVIGRRGRLTGGGWIKGPMAGNNKTGRANLEVVAQYKKGSQQPSGNLNFVWGTENRHFRTSTFEYLVTSENTAWLKGTGKMDGAELDFLLTVVDGDAGYPENNKDKIRMVISDKTGNTIYDNLEGAPSKETMALSGGSFTIHKDHQEHSFAKGSHGIYPNPFKESFTLQFDDNGQGPVSITLLDYHGNIVLEQASGEAFTNSIFINTPESIVPPGLYVVRLKQGDQVKTFRALRQ